MFFISNPNGIGGQVMLVGEQPGDKEDLAGKPFVGPAGQMLDRALEEAGIERKKAHGKNLHQKPDKSEIIRPICCGCRTRKPRCGNMHVLSVI
jgi:uracil-DNA glycosylase family 4